MSSGCAGCWDIRGRSRRRRSRCHEVRAIGWSASPRSDAEWRFVDREVPPIIERVREAKANFPPADHVSAEGAARLDAVLERY